MIFKQENKTTHSTITMKSGSTLTAPISWKSNVGVNHQAFTSPEDDVTVYFLEVPTTDALLEKTVAEAWKQVHPDFDLKQSQALFPPVKDSWEKSYTVVYDVPTSESRMVIAAGNLFKNQAYICLLEATTAGLSRRSAEIMGMVGSWKPSEFAPEDLNNNEMKTWTDIETQAFNEFIVDAMQKLNVPGVSIAVVRRDGQSVYRNAFGVKQLGMDDPVTIDTPFMIGSITKPLTTLMMGMLIDQKKIAWDTRITDILPDFKLADGGMTQKLTMRHTVSASTGMPRRDLDFIFKHSHVTPEERLSQMSAMKPTTKLGEVFQYSNYLVMAGGYAAARAYSPTSNLENAYALAMQELVFNPFQMNNTVLKADDAIKLGAAKPHGTGFDGELHTKPMSMENSCYSVAPAGAIWSTVTDLSRYMLLEMNGGILDGERLISEQSILERRKPGIACGEGMFYGLGLVVGKDKGLNMIGHDGGTMGFSSVMTFFPDKDLGIVALTNTRSAHTFIGLVIQKLLELTFSAMPRSEEMLKNAEQMQALSVKTMSEQTSLDIADMQWMEHLVGEYLSDSLGRLVISKSIDQGGYEIAFEEWSSRAGCKIEANGEKIITLIDGSVPGMKLHVDKDFSQLSVDGGQDKHKFTRVDRNEIAHLCDQPTETEQHKDKSSWIKYGLFGATAVALIAGGCAVYNQLTNTNKR